MDERKEFLVSDISRRTFLKLSGVLGGLALGGGSLLQNVPPVLAEPAQAGTPLPFGADTVVNVRCGSGDVCGAYHQANAYVKNGVVVYYDGCRESENAGGLCPRGASGMQLIYHPDRVKYPMKRINERGIEGKFQRITWDEALNTITDKMVEAIKAEGPHTVNFASGHTMTGTIGQVRGRLQSLFNFSAARGPKLCWENLIVGPWITLGDYHHALEEDFHNSKLIIIWGHNKVLSMPSEWRGILEAKEKFGAKIVVIDPRYSETAEKADIFMPVRPGTDAALALGMANVLITENLINKDFIEKYTLGYDEYRDLALQYPPEKVEEITWCPADRIRQVARMYATIKPAMLEFGRGGNYEAGDTGWLCSRGATCLIGLTGQIGVSGSGFSVEDSTINPTNTNFGAPYASLNRKGDPIVPAKLTAPSDPWAQRDILYYGKPFRYRVLITTSELASQNPDQNACEAGMMQIPFIVVDNRFINWTASRYADMVLPAALWTEQAMVYQDRTHLICTRPAVKPMFECKPDWQLYGELAVLLAKKLGSNLAADDIWPYKTDEDVVNAMYANKDLPLGGFPKLNYQEASKHPEGYRMTRYYNQAGFVPYHENGDPTKPLLFYTPSGKIEFKAQWLTDKFRLPALPIHVEPTESPVSTPDLFKQYPLISHARVHPHWGFLHYNLVADGGTASPLLREAFVTASEPKVTLNPRTADKMGLKEGDMVWVESKYGKLQGRLLVSERIHPQMVATPLYWSNCENRINPPEISLRVGIKFPQKGPFGEGITSKDLGGQSTFAGVLVKVYKA